MPAKAKVTKEMIVDAAFSIARQAGAENINARTVSERLHCSTQPVMYHFATIEELKRTVYARADVYHSEYLMNMKKPPRGAALGIGMNYIRFAIEEPHLFRFLFQSDYFSGKTLLELIDAVDNPAVQICIDTGHANMVGLDVPAMIRQVGTHLKATHINDNHGKTDEHFAPYNGTIPWKETVQALRDIGYQECFAFEIHHLTSMYPKEVQPAQVDFSYALGSYLLRE